MNRNPERRSGSIASGASVIATLMVAASLMALMPPSSSAQAVPIPKPAPTDHTSAQTGAPGTLGSLGSALTTAITSVLPPDPIIPDPNRSVPVNAFPTFDAKQKAEAAKVSTWLSSVQTLVGNFIQVGPDGTKTKGEFYIQKPGKVRFEYDDPSPIEIIADGSSLVVRDRNLATQDVYPLSETPLRYLLSNRIDLMKDTHVVNVSADDSFITVTIEEKQALVGTSRLMLMMGAKDGQLKQWTVTDPQGYDTTVAVYNLDSPKKLDPSLFKIDWTNYGTGPSPG